MKIQLTALNFLLLGLVIGVLVAPRSGQASRQLLIDKLSEALQFKRS